MDERIGSIGITDLILFHPCGAVLFLELKTTTGRLSPEQKDWKKSFDEHGFAHSHAVAYGFTQARETIDLWLTSIHAPCKLE